MYTKLTIALLSSISLPLCAATFNVRDFGATGDGHTLDTAAIQKAVDTASTNGGGIVLVPAGHYLTDPFTLASGIDFHLDANAVILIDNDMTRYPVARNRYQDAITATGAHDLGISGDGIIDGQGEVWWQAFRDNPNMTHRPFMIKFLNCTNLNVTGVTLRNSPMFHLVTQNCTDVTISGITIKSPKYAANTDGIDPSGWNYLITGCDIDTGDDDIAIKPAPGSGRTPGNKHFVVKDCNFGHGHGMSVGGGSAGGLEDLLVDNCSFYQTDYGIRIKTLRGNGGVLTNCIYENLSMIAIRISPISILDYYPERDAPADPATETAVPITDRTPLNCNIVIQNVIATDCANAGVIRGLPEAPIDGLTFSNVNLFAQSGMTIYHGRGVRFVDSSIKATHGQTLTTFDATVTGLK